MPRDPIFDPVGIIVWAIDVGIYDVMNTAWGWPIAEIAHFIGICLLIGSVGLFDLVMLGWIRGLPLPALHRLIPLGIVGFVITATSGFMFVVSAPDQYLYNPAWQLKMALLAVAGLNMLAFYLLGARQVRTLGEDQRPPRRARIFAGISLASWVGIITLGRVITAFRPPSWFWCAWCG